MFRVNSWIVKSMDVTRHIPVLLKEVVTNLALAAGNTVVDATLGGGGYTKAFLEKVGNTGQVIALDTDQSAIDRFEMNEGKKKGNLILKKANFSTLTTVLAQLGIKEVDCVVADLGFSSDQMNDPSRGLSFMNDGPLDMRFDPSDGGIRAEDLLVKLSENDLREVFSRYGEEPEAGRIARAIVQTRMERSITTTGELRDLILRVYPKGKRARMKIHPATRTFQSLRIVVNHEDEHLEKFLESALACLKPGGRMAVVAFHSGEDRVVKNFFRTATRPCICPPDFPTCACGKKPKLKIITKKPIMPSEAEIQMNPRARSAVLRIAEKI